MAAEDCVCVMLHLENLAGQRSRHKVQTNTVQYFIRKLGQYVMSFLSNRKLVMESNVKFSLLYFMLHYIYRYKTASKSNNTKQIKIKAARLAKLTFNFNCNHLFICNAPHFRYKYSH